MRNVSRERAYTAVTEDGKVLGYILFPPLTSRDDGPRPPPKLYTLNGYLSHIGHESESRWARALRIAESKKEKTIVADKLMAEDFLDADKSRAHQAEALASGQHFEAAKLASIAEMNEKNALLTDQIRAAGIAFGIVLAVGVVACVAIAVGLRRRWKTRLLLAGSCCVLFLVAQLVFRSYAAADYKAIIGTVEVGYADVGRSLALVWGAVAIFSLAVVLVARPRRTPCKRHAA